MVSLIYNLGLVVERGTRSLKVGGSSLSPATVLSDASPSVPLLGIKGYCVWWPANGTLHAKDPWLGKCVGSEFPIRSSHLIMCVHLRIKD